MLVINDTQITYYPKRVLIYNKYTILLVNETIQFYDSKNYEKVSFMQKGINDLCILKKINRDNKNYAEYIIIKHEMKLELITFKKDKLKKICKLEFPTTLKDWTSGEDIIYLNTEAGSFIISISKNQLIAKSIQKFHDLKNLQITKLTKTMHALQYSNTFNLSRYSYNSLLNVLKPQELFKTNAIKILVTQNVVLSVFSNSINIISNNSHLKDFNIKMPTNIFLFNIHLIKIEEDIFRLWNGDGSIIEIHIIMQCVEFIFIEKLNCFGLKKSHDIQIKKVGINEYKRIIKGISESIKPIINTDNKFYKEVVSSNNKIVVLTDKVFVIKIKGGMEQIKKISNATKIIDSTKFYTANGNHNIFIANRNALKKVNKNLIKNRVLHRPDNVCFLKIFTTKNFLLLSYQKEYKEEVRLFFKEQNINISKFIQHKSIIKNIWEINNFVVIYLQDQLVVFFSEANIKVYNFSDHKEIVNIEAFKEHILIQFKRGGCFFIKEFTELEKDVSNEFNLSQNIVKYKENVFILNGGQLILTTEDSYFKNKSSLSEIEIINIWILTNLPINIYPSQTEPKLFKEPLKEIQSFQIIEIYNYRRPNHFRILLILETDYETVIYEKCKDSFFKKHQFISKGYYFIRNKAESKANHISCIIFYPNKVLLNTSNGLVVRDLNIHIYENQLYHINNGVLENFLNFFKISFQNITNKFMPLLYFNHNELSILNIGNSETPLINLRQNKNIEFIKATEDHICLVINKREKIQFPAEESFSNEVVEEERENIIRKTTNLVITKKYKIEIYQTRELKKIGVINFEVNESVTDLVIKNGFQTDNFSENQTKNGLNFLYITTTKSIGRNLQSIGVIYLFDLKTSQLIYKEENDAIIKSINVFDFPIQPIKSYNLLCEFNTNPRNPSNVNHFHDTKNRNVLMVGCGDQLKIYNSHMEFMEPIAFYDLNQLIERIFCIKNFIVVIDRKMGIHLFFLQLEPIQLHLLSSSNLPVESLLINFNSKCFLRTFNILNDKNILKNKLFLEIENENEIFFITKHLLNTSLNVLTYSPNNIKGQGMVCRGTYDMKLNVFCRGNIMFSFNSIFETCEYNFLIDDSPLYLFDKFIEILLLKQQSDLNILNEYKIKSFEANKTPMIESKILRNFMLENGKYKTEVCKIAGLEYSEVVCILSRIFL